MEMKGFAALIAALSAGIGCGGGGGDVTVSTYVQRSIDLVCEKSFECCDSTEIMARFGFFNVTTEAQCKSTLGAFANIGVNDLNASISAGRIKFDGDAASACLALFEGLSCAEFSSTDSEQMAVAAGCTNPIQGQVANGGACSDDDECVSENCVGASDDPPTDGMCEALPDAGAECDSDCAPGYYCQFGSP